ncbi:transposase [Streptomyces sp. ME18-1-4]|nr:transposase [Streptomyces sp. ME18-1-4]
MDAPRLRQVLAGLSTPQAADGRLVLAVDVSNWLRPEAQTSAERLFCHVYGRSGRSSDPASGRRPSRTGRRCRRGHRRPGPPGGHGPDRDEPLACRRPRHPGRLQRRLRCPAHGPPPARTAGGGPRAHAQTGSCAV